MFAEEGDQAIDFSYNVSALEAQTSVKNMHCGVVALDNNSRRKGDLAQPLDDVSSFEKFALNSST